MNKSNLESSQKITHPDYEIHYQILHKKMQRIFPVSADRSNCHSPGMLREKATFSSMHDANEKSHMMEKVFTALIANNVSELQNLLSGHRHKTFDINETLIGNIKLINVAALLGFVEALDILKINGAAFVAETSSIHPLFTAVIHNQFDVVKKLVSDYHINLNMRGLENETVLHIAVANESIAMSTYLLQAGANPNPMDSAGFTPILLATLLGNISLFNLLKLHGADMGTKTTGGQYIFHFMSMHHSFLHHLKKYRTFYTVSDNRDCTCLHFAITSGNVKATREILRHGKHQLDLMTFDRHTAISLSCASGQPKVLDYILRKYYADGREIQPYESPLKGILKPIHVTAEKGNIATMQMLEKHDLFPIDDKTSKRCFTALHLSCMRGNEELALYLLDKNADCRQVDSKGWYPIHYSVQNSLVMASKRMLSSFKSSDFAHGTSLLHLACKNGNIELSSLLLDKDYDPCCRDSLGYSPLHYAASKGYNDILQKLLLKNAKVHRTSAFSETPLFLACINGRAEAVRKLKRAGANINIPNQEGTKAFHEACRRGHVRVIEVILEVPAMRFDINGLSREGLAPLHLACANNQQQIAGILVREGADISVLDAQGRTAMHHAAANGHLRIIESLIQLGAKWKSKDYDELTPLQYALKNRHFEVADYLETVRPMKQVLLEKNAKGRELNLNASIEEIGSKIFNRRKLSPASLRSSNN